MMKSPITNLWRKAPLKEIRVEHRTIFQAKRGCAFNHQAQLNSVDGVLFASWSQGVLDEDSPGQVPVLSVSKDGGRTWGPPRAIFSHEAERRTGHVKLNSGLIIQGSDITAYFGEWQLRRDVFDRSGRVKGAERGDGAFFDALEEAKSKMTSYATARGHIGVRTLASRSGDLGETWSDPVEVVPKLISWQRPRRLRSGRWLLAGSASFAYTDDPAGISGWKRSFLPGLTESFVDGLEGWFSGREARHDRVIFSQGSFYETDDGCIRMMLRTEMNYLAVTVSTDDGQSWSEPALTEYSDNVGRPNFGRLPDGRFYGLNCPSIEGRRTPAVLAVSEDGVVFDKHYLIGREESHGMRYPGYLKGGRYGYPLLHIVDGRGFVVYSIEKEDIAIAEFDLGELS